MSRKAKVTSLIDQVLADDLSQEQHDQAMRELMKDYPEYGDIISQAWMPADCFFEVTHAEKIKQSD